MSASSAAKRLSNVRQLLRERNLDALLVPHTDPHSSEYFSPRFERRQWLTNFTGSAGDALVSMEDAKLWTDGRYWTQATRELFPTWELVQDGSPGVKSLDEFLASADSFPSHETLRLGVDPFLISSKRWKSLNALPHIQLHATKDNVVDCAGFALDFDGSTTSEEQMIQVLDERFSGKSAAAKIEETRAVLKSMGANSLLVSTLDDVAWLCNLRGGDVPYTPLFLGYVYLEMNCVTLFVDACKLSDSASVYLERQGVNIAEYASLDSFLRKRNTPATKICLDVSSSSFAITESLNDCTILEQPNPTLKLKSIKNDVELQGVRACHIRDGYAKTKFLFWLEEAILSGEVVDECAAADKLEEYRKSGKHFQGLSFPSISGCDENGAVLHYHALKESARVLTKDSMYLIDSGAQYLDGTTDVTRTIHFGTPSDYQKECYTRVLKGFIAVHRQKFPAGTTIGPQLDGLARHSLWEAGLDFAHVRVFSPFFIIATNAFIFSFRVASLAIRVSSRSFKRGPATA